jgi:hypothetical protein
MTDGGTSAITLETTVEIPDDVVFRNLEGEAVLLNLQSGTYFGLDPVGTAAWLLVAEDGRLRHVFEQMLREFEVAPEVLEEDLLDLVRRLATEGLVTVRTTQP